MRYALLLIIYSLLVQREICRLQTQPRILKINIIKISTYTLLLSGGVKFEKRHFKT